MAVAPLQQLAASQARPQAGGRPALRPAPGGPARLGQDARKLGPRDVGTTLPQLPAKFTSPEDFKAYVSLVVQAGLALKLQAAGPKANLDAAEARLKAHEAELGAAVHVAQTAVAGASFGSKHELAALDRQVEQAQKALDGARNPGQARAAQLRQEIEALKQRQEKARRALDAAQADVEAGRAEGKSRAAGYAAIAMNQHAIGACQTQIDAKHHEIISEAARTLPDYDPRVQDASARLADLQQRRAQLQGDAQARVAPLQARLEEAQREYEAHLTPARKDVDDARAAYAPAKAALDRARARVSEAANPVTKTQRALWWARGFNLDAYLQDQVRALS